MSTITFTLLGATLFSATGFAADFEYYHFDKKVQLGVDTTMIAIFDEEEQLEAPTFTTGIPDAIASSTVQGWSYVKTPKTSQSNFGIGQLIDQLIDAEQYDFVSPIFAGEGGLPYIPTRDLLLKRTAEANAVEVTTMLEKIGVILDTNFSGMDRVYRVRTALRDGRDVLSLANELAQLDIFEFAESDAIAWVKPMHIPNDPEFNQQWGLNQANDHDMNLPEAWDITMGSEDVVVVVLDSGIEQSHPDIHQLTGESFTGSSSNGNPGNSCDNHGTAVSGCIAATIDNNQGVAGVAPHCWVRAGKIFNEMDIFGFCLGFLEFQESWAVSGITWAADSGAKVTNSSWGGGSPLSAITNAFNTTRAAGVFHVAAAGNDGSTTIGWPGNLDSLIAVAAMSSNGTLASFSTHGSGLFISAPGEGIRTTDRSGGDGYDSGNTVTIDGTSFASPYTAGVVALLLSVDSSLTPDQIEEILSSTAVDYGSSGYDTTFGYGFINALNALEAVGGGQPCVGDVDGDEVVGVSDLLAVVDAWGACSGCNADVDGDGTVGVSDILAVVDAWGTCS
jgi:subtilisin family serine protease|tara:strand:+ start:3174 stop:4856 length:1683 start_codon:yes stop_codon:yes gene_type:complete